MLKNELLAEPKVKAKIFRIVKALYGLNEFDLQIYSIIKERNEITLKDLIQITGKNKPLIVKALQNLEKLNLISKQKIRSEKRGRPSYIYKINIQIENLLLNDLKNLLNLLNY